MITAATSFETDILIVGGGIIGATIAHFLAPRRAILLLDTEEHFGYHATGRSAAMFAPSYGSSIVQELTRASRAFLEKPPRGEGPLLRARGQLVFAPPDQVDLLETRHKASEASGASVERLTSSEASRLVPLLNGDLIRAAFLDRSVLDIEVHSFHSSMLTSARRAGAVIQSAEVLQGERGAGHWQIETSAGPVAARIVINAAGAWADVVATRLGSGALGHLVLRRTAVIVPCESLDPASWPAVEDAAETFYFKPDAGNLLLSPADESPSAPCDAQAEELDVAIAIDRFERATGQQVRRPLHRWAGLRTFSPDRDPVIGWDVETEGLFWASGFGGFGVQTAAAAARIVSEFLQKGAPQQEWAALSPSRFAEVDPVAASAEQVS